MPLNCQKFGLIFKKLFYVTIVIFTILSLHIDDGFASENKTPWEIDKAKVFEYIDKNQCDKAWPILWKWSKAGNKDARRWTSTAFISVGMTIPGAPSDIPALLRYSNIFAAHALSDQNSSRDNEFLVNILLGGLFAGIRGGHPFKNCLESNKLDNCVSIAVTERSVPDFNAFVAEIEMLINSTRQKSICSLEPLR